MARLSHDMMLSWYFLVAILILLLVAISGSAFLVLGQMILAPIVFSVVIGLMFGPIADRIEGLGIHPAISGLIIVLLFSIAIIGTLSAIIIPLSGWSVRLPALWERLQQVFGDWQGALSALNGIREKIDMLTQQDADIVVQVDEGLPIKNVFTIAPGMLAQTLMFLASLYFFIATRQQIKTAIVRVFISQHAGYCGARIFRDVERQVSQYLLSISIINLAVAIAVSTVLWAIGVPGAFMWGLLAGLLNYITFVGPALMIAILLGVGLLSFDTNNLALMPAALYLTINFVESQFVTPMFIGRTLLLNPFLVFFSITFWIWAWGPLGGFVAVPSLLIAKGVLSNLNRVAHLNTKNNIPIRNK